MDGATPATVGDSESQLTVTIKLYASLGVYLPDGAKQNMADVPVRPGTTVLELLDSYNLPREACHLVLVNGIFSAPAARATQTLAEGDAVAVWPPVAGG